MSTTVKSSNVGGEYQPLPMAPMDVKEAPKPRGEKQKRSRQLRDAGGPNCYCHCEYNVRESGNQQQEHGDEHGHSEHGGCHRKRLRRAAHFSFASVVMLTLVLFMAFKCRLDLALFGSPEGVHISGSGLEKRQSTGSTGSSSNGSTQGSFVKNKLYLIIVFVGLFICLILAVMLAAWCCKGAFENPLCCPCYLCACCGGLACLECISCGLCAEGVEQINF